MYQLYTIKKSKTGWVQLAIVIILTFIAFYYIKNSFAKPYAEFKLYNEVRIAEIYGLESEAEESEAEESETE